MYYQKKNSKTYKLKLHLNYTIFNFTCHQFLSGLNSEIIILIRLVQLVLNISSAMQEDHSIPKLTCLQSNEAKMLCGSKNCHQNAFICTNQVCEHCKSKHITCQMYRIPNIISKLKTKKKKPTAAIKKAVGAMQKILDEAIQKLSIYRERLKDELEMYGNHQAQIRFLKLLQGGCLKQINGSIVSQLMQTLNQEKIFNTDQKTIKVFWQNREKQFNQIFDKFMKLPSKKYNGLNSKITDQLKLIEDFLPNPVYNINLLFRASENKFSTKQFHRICDDKPNTLTLAKTEFGKIIGGFTNQTWSGNNHYKQDTDNETFLFSITKKQKYPCCDTANAIYCKNDYGPTFGSGHDFHIGQKSDTLRNNSYFNFATSYNTEDSKYLSDEAAFTQFCGAKEGQYYARLTEWQVFQIEFL